MVHIDPAIRRAIVSDRAGCLGVYGSTDQAGRIAVGDAVILEDTLRRRSSASRWWRRSEIRMAMAGTLWFAAVAARGCVTVGVRIREGGRRMRQPALLVVLGVIGCHHNFDICIGSRPQFCLATAPEGTITVSENGDIDTDSMDPPFACELTDQMSYCVITAENITITATTKLRAIGSRPLVLLASGKIDIQGALDVSSSLGPTGAGAGADPATCERAQAATGTAGGAGGSFGGKGGDGQAKTVLVSGGGIGGKAVEPLSEVPDLRGGCPGGDGAHVDGNGTEDNSGGPGGHGGGAVALIANEIQISGTINASGAGGGGRPLEVDGKGMGGGGGGSGGMLSCSRTVVVVDAAQETTLEDTLAAYRRGPRVREQVARSSTWSTRGKAVAVEMARPG